MKKTLFFLAPLGLAFALTSCNAGPHQLRRSVDDWDQKTYVQNPWINAALWILPLPVMYWGAQIGDFLITDAYAFWFKDAWDMKGTAFTHYNVTPTDGSMSSLLNDDGEFLTIK